MGAMAKKKKQVRTGFRKNRSPRTRQNELTRQFQGDDAEKLDDGPRNERISGKGELTRKRTVQSAEIVEGESGFAVMLDVDESKCCRGRVVSVYGLTSMVEDEAGRAYQCATRRLLKTLSTDQRHVVASGDRVLFRISGPAEGIIERVEPRHGVLSRTSRGRQHIIVANVDQIVIVASAAEPYLKPNLIDRYLVTAERSRIQPVICINKIDLVDAAKLQPLVGVYAQMGYPVLMVSARTGQNVDRLRHLLQGRQSVVSGQSGVGKSSLLNAIEQGLGLRVNAVSSETQKGKHTTTTARVLRIAAGGYVVDTPGLRQFQLWDIVPEEVASYYRDLRPFVSQCRYADCTHQHESHCAVKDAVADGLLNARRYESYCHVVAGDDE
jgi:ribosome biogenesis GTPase